MLNFRKFKQDFSSSIVKEGKEFFDSNKVVSAKILHLDSRTLRIGARILGQYDNHYESEIEIDRIECETIDSNCGCPYSYDYPQNLLDQFIYDETTFKLHFNHTKKIDSYEIQLEVKGALAGIKLSQLWDCIAAKKAFIELATLSPRGKRKPIKPKWPRFFSSMSCSRECFFLRDSPGFLGLSNDAQFFGDLIGDPDPTEG